MITFTRSIYRIAGGRLVLSTLLLAIDLQAGLLVPPSQWGTTFGGISVLIQNYSGPSDFTIGPNSLGNSISATIASNKPPNSLTPNNGQGGGTVTSYVDQHGAHVFGQASAVGEASTSINARSGFSDTLYNNTNSSVQFQLTFHLDATLYTLSSARDTLTMNFYRNGALADVFLSDQILNGAGTYDVINQDFTSQTYTIAPNSSFVWGIDIAAFVGVSSKANRTYLAGLPYGYIDALNTLSVTQLQAFDSQGGSLSNTVLTSGSGFDYAGAAATPEPATWLSAATAAALALLLRRKRA